MPFGFKRNTPTSTETVKTAPAELFEEQTLESELVKARQLLDKDVAEQVLPEGVVATGLNKKYFQSRTFKAAAYDAMTDRYGDSDRSLITVSLEAGAQVFIASGKISSGNPYEVKHAAGQGIDLRGTYSVAYIYDGKETITEYTGGTTNTYQGEYGVPEALLPHLRESLGTPVGSETF